MITITKIQIVLNTQKNPYLVKPPKKYTCQNVSTQENPEIENFKPQKVLRLSLSLEIRRTPNHCWSHKCNKALKSRLNLIVRVNVVLNRTVVVDSDWRFDKLCGSHLQSPSELYHVSWWYYTLVIDLNGQIRRDVIIGRLSSCLSVKLWCYWLWILVISSWCVSIRLLSKLNGRLLLVKLSILQSFSRSQFCLISSISVLYGVGNYWLRFSGVCSKLANQLSKVSRW